MRAIYKNVDIFNDLSLQNELYSMLSFYILYGQLTTAENRIQLDIIFWIFSHSSVEIQCPTVCCKMFGVFQVSNDRTQPMLV